MRQKRLETICSYLMNQDNIIDIGCDHAYVCIEMAKRGAKKILATDIHENALNIAKENIKKSGYPIEFLCSDGLKKVDTTNYDTLVLAGMGATTILHILEDQEKLIPIKKIIIQSNNEWKKIRKSVSKLGFYLKDETIIYEKKHYYTIMEWSKGIKKQKKIVENLGIWKPEHQSYYQQLLETQKRIYNSIPKRKWWTRIQRKKEQKEIQKYLKITN